jgi:CheY-like chemotaxis protein
MTKHNNKFQGAFNKVKDVPILVIDDDKVNLKVISLFLREYGFVNIDTALSGNEGIDLYTKNNYAIVFLDLNMPDLNGIDVCKIIKHMPDKKQIPVIAVSALAEEIMDECKLAGFADYVLKPLDINIFKGVIEKWIDKN